MIAISADDHATESTVSVCHSEIMDVVFAEVTELDGDKSWMVEVACAAKTYSNVFVIPESVIESFVTAVAVKFVKAFVVRIPTNVCVFVVKESNDVWFVVVVVKWTPNPTVSFMMAPNAVMLRRPSPWIIRNPSIAVTHRPRPVAVGVRTPFFIFYDLVGVRNPVTKTFDDDPTTLATECVVRIELFAIVLIRCSNDLCRWNVARTEIVIDELDGVHEPWLSGIHNGDRHGLPKIVRNIEAHAIVGELKT